MSDPTTSESPASTEVPVNPYANATQNPYASSSPGGVPMAPAVPNAYQPTNPYAAQAYNAAGAGYYPQRTNPLAIASLIVSLGGLVIFPGSIVGIVLGHVALAQIARHGEAGRGLAIGGLVAGYIITGLGLLFVLLYVIFFIIGLFALSGL